FCGFGEPTEAWEVLKPVAAYVKEAFRLPVRVNTNGQGSLICGRDIAPEFAGLVDAVSISLNTPNPERYAELTRSRFGEVAFPAMLDFAREVKSFVPEVTMTTVETTLTPEEEDACRAICEDLGVNYRIRLWVEEGKVTK
ncbi:MAG: radical SAM protein, partial [Enterorhabdus sp.]|nr:radical SAM protein [Enterorhabdus sp.]